MSVFMMYYNTLLYLRWFWVHYIPSLQACLGFSTKLAGLTALELGWLSANLVRGNSVQSSGLYSLNPSGSCSVGRPFIHKPSTCPQSTVYSSPCNGGTWQYAGFNGKWHMWVEKMLLERYAVVWCRISIFAITHPPNPYPHVCRRHLILFWRPPE